MTIELTALFMTEAVDAALEIGCQFRNPDCSQRATWLAILPCGHDRAFCDGHREYTVARCAYLLDYLRCPDCGTEWATEALVIRWEPLR